METWNRQFTQKLSLRVVEVRHGLSEIKVRRAHDPVMDAPRQLPVAIPESTMLAWFRHCTEYTSILKQTTFRHVRETRKRQFAHARARTARGCLVRKNFSCKISYNISKYLYHFSNSQTTAVARMFTWICLVHSRIYPCFAGGCRTRLQPSRRGQSAHFR
jgi:hypothetical protein